ncbi:uncharacterized protein LOC144359867 [Saccoglossus kowalevskii]
MGLSGLLAGYWHVDDARYLKCTFQSINIKVDAADKFGRTPLHVAAAQNKAGMIEFLLDNKALIERKTYGQKHTPLAFAAENNSLEAIQALIKRGADVNSSGGRGRTPLMLATMAKHEKACLLLLKHGAQMEAVDDDGKSCFEMMLKMKDLAEKALNHLYRVDSIEHNLFYSLDKLDKLDIIDNLEFKELIQMKWKKEGGKDARIYFILVSVFVMLWTALSLVKPNGRACYDFPLDILHVLLWVAAIGYTVAIMIYEVRRYHKLKKEFKKISREVTNYTTGILTDVDMNNIYCEINRMKQKINELEVFAYVERQWILSFVMPPSTWSCYLQSVRTNNDVEGWHSRLNKKGKKANLPFYLLVTLLHREATIINVHVRLVSEKKLRSRQKKKFRDLQGRIFKLWEEFQRNEISVEKLLRSSSRLYGNAPVVSNIQ